MNSKGIDGVRSRKNTSVPGRKCARNVNPSTDYGVLCNSYKLVGYRITEMTPQFYTSTSLHEEWEQQPRALGLVSCPSRPHFIFPGENRQELLTHPNHFWNLQVGCPPSPSTGHDRSWDWRLEYHPLRVRYSLSVWIQQVSLMKR